jgi:hypothetical protein
MTQQVSQIKMLITDYQYPFGCAVFSFLSLCLFLVLGFSLDPDWFGRGGSIIVLFAVAAEYGLVTIQSAEMTNRGNQQGKWGAPILRFEMPEPFSKLKIVAHILAVVGTLIWGFGDLFIESVLQKCLTKT